MRFRPNTDRPGMEHAGVDGGVRLELLHTPKLAQNECRQRAEGHRQRHVESHIEGHGAPPTGGPIL